MDPRFSLISMTEQMDSMTGMPSPIPDPEPRNRVRSGCLPQLTVLAIFAVVAINIALNYEREQSNAAAPATARAVVGERATGTAIVGTVPSPDPVEQATFPMVPSPQPSPTSAPPPQPSATVVPPPEQSPTPTLPTIAIARDSAFWETWARTDKPVADRASLRAWTWGDERSMFTREMSEPYADFEPSGMRQVAYFDHGRMEITHQDDEQTAPWNVTVGLLVVEMVEGRIQVGKDDFDESHEPAEIDIFFGPDTEGGLGLTYADINALGLREEPPVTEGRVITQRINRNGTLTDDRSLVQHNVTSAIRVQVPGLDHSVASPFWEYMNLVDVVFVTDDQTGTGQNIVENLFEAPFYATGYPITEPYWARVSVDGQERDVLWQCFERRCLTYTPGNRKGFEVISGNVGQHYFLWRYGDILDELEQAEQATADTSVLAVKTLSAAALLLTMLVSCTRRL